MATNRQPSRLSSSRTTGSRTSNSRTSGGRASVSRSSGRPSSAGSRASGRSGNTASRSSSYRKSSGRSNSSRTPSKGRAQNNSSPSSGMSSFYKAMVLLAICGIAAALYTGGHLSNLSSVIADFSASSITDGLTGILSETDSSAAASKNTTSTTTTSTAAVTTTTASSTTEKSKTTTSTTTTTTKTKKTTTTTTVADSGKNAKYVKSPNYESPYYIVVFTGSQSVVVYSKDSDGNYTVQTKAFKCSTGASGTPTRTGMYSILRSYRWRLLMGGVYGQYCSGISSSYLFHSVLYDKKDNSTLFENSYKNLGSAASHGCIRLSVRDAKWIYDNCPHGTQVNIVNADGPAGAELPPLKSGNEYRGWEPTDPDKNNPYNKKEDSSSDTTPTSSTANSDDSETTASTTTETTLPPPVVG